MLIGLVLLGCVAALLFFGVAERVFKNFGMAYWIAFIVVGALIGSAFIPSFDIGGARIHVGGFVAPIVVASVFVFLAARTRELRRVVITASAVVALFTALELLIGRVTDKYAAAAIEGILCGACAYLIGKTELAALASIFIGISVGAAAAGVTAFYAFGEKMAIGGANTYSAIIIAAVFAVALYEAVAAVKRRAAVSRKTAAAVAEIDPDEYKKYFDE